MNKLARVTLVLTLFAVACGDDDAPAADARPTSDSGPTFDAPPMVDGTPASDAAPVMCLAVDDFGAATLANQAAQSNGPAATPGSMSGGGTLNTDAMPDVFQLELYKGFGAFMTGEIRVGTYTIAGAELNYATCGVCPRVFADVDTATGAALAQYYATGGTVTITSVLPNLTYTFADVTFEHVTIDPTTFESTPHADMCQTMIVSGSFDATVMNTP